MWFFEIWPIVRIFRVLTDKFIVFDALFTQISVSLLEKDSVTKFFGNIILSTMAQNDEFLAKNSSKMKSHFMTYRVPTPGLRPVSIATWDNRAPGSMAPLKPLKAG
jgi:hypothetical protein